MVPADEAIVINRLGDPVRVLTKPGLSWKLPAPIETITSIDLRLRTTSTGLQDVGTKDGSRVLVQVFTAWQVPDSPQAIRQFLRALRNQPDEAALQLRSFVSAGMHITSSNFNLSDLINTDASKVRLDGFERQLASQIAPQMLQGYGIQIRQVGVERMTLPDVTLAATVARMSAERETVAATVTANGLRQAAQIQSDADRDGRETVAKAQQEAAKIQADAEGEAAQIYAKAYKADPNLYTTLRSLDTVGKVMGPNTTVILRTDAAPFRVLSEGPAGAKGGK
jgi:membrane protease subunit HflC